MKFDPEKHHRRSIRIPGYDYSQDGHYFVTICAQDRDYMFGSIVDGQIKLNSVGKMVYHWWNQIPQKYQNIELDEFVIMPNHIHGIIIIDNFGDGRGEVTSPLPISKQHPTLGQIIVYFKYQSTKQINQMCNSPGDKLWQRNYYEHVIHDDIDLNRIRQYIIYNPIRWDDDKYYS